MRSYIHLMLLFLLASFALSAKESQEEQLLKRDIKDYQKRIAALEKEIQTLAEEEKEDRVQQKGLTEKQEETLLQLQTDISNLKAEQKELQKRNKSLNRKAKKISANIAYLQRTEKELLVAVSLEGEKLLQFLDSLPPSIVEKRKAALQFLLTEIANKTVSAAEGTERLFTIYRALERDSHSYEVWQGKAPVSGRAGLFTYIRLGFFYVAAVSESGNTAFLYFDGKWQQLSSPDECKQLFRAAQVALEERTPEFTLLPFSLKVIKEGVKQ